MVKLQLWAGSHLSMPASASRCQDFKLTDGAVRACKPLSPPRWRCRPVQQTWSSLAAPTPCHKPSTTSLDEYSTTVAPIICPFTGEELRAVAAVNPDLSVIHAQRADRKGNVQLWGITGIQKEALLAGRKSLVTVEEIVDVLDPRHGDVILPSWLVTAVAAVPGGSRPSYAAGYYQRDNDFYIAWDSISRDRETFLAWMDENVL